MQYIPLDNPWYILLLIFTGVCFVMWRVGKAMQAKPPASLDEPPEGYILWNGELHKALEDLPRAEKATQARPPITDRRRRLHR